MAIVVENYYDEEGRLYKKTYSDSGYVIRQMETGYCFAEAIDPHDSLFTYEETNDLIDPNPEISEEENLISYTANDLITAAKILLGEVE